MRHELAVPFLDAAASGLRWCVGPAAAAPPALCATTVRRDGHRLELRILGASHAVVVHPADGRSGTAEVVACGAPAGTALPLSGARTRRGGLVWETDASIERPGRAALAAVAQRLRDAEATDPETLLAGFPGHADALTVLRPSPDRAAWESWHLYPATGEVVRTRTALADVRAATGRGAVRAPAGAIA